MPADIPVEEPSGRVNEPAGPHAWARLGGWEILLVGSIVVPCAHLLVDDTPPPLKALCVTLLLSILVAYALIGRKATLRQDVRLATVYVALLVVLFAVPSAIADISTFALFGICPQIFMALPVRRALVALVLLAIPKIATMWSDASDLEGVFSILTLLTTVIVFSAVFGVWGDRIVRQSIERADLIRRLEASHAEVARLSAERGALAERERLAQEIHDTLAQGFTSIIMLLQAAEAQPDPRRHLGLAVQTAKENLAEARALIAALGPAPLDGSTLDDALRRVTDRLGEDLGLQTVFETRGDGYALPPSYEVVLIRAAQEGLNNVRKHAAASRVKVTLEYGPLEVALRVRDNGRGFGFPPRSLAEHADDASAGYGLQAMRARVEQVRGSITVGDVPAGGANEGADYGADKGVGDGAEEWAGGGELVVRLPLPGQSPVAAEPVRDSLPVETG
ncbi:sensor histidine kinase [Thermopolyspora sp. NPDC052614]|uniref:sensor histidine kinase n=1 Tax=Thermopolyspora sp. NPDC052614 TaxID=3155682 RepID=UPI00343CE212